MEVGGNKMAKYEAQFQPFYKNGWENQPSENTPIMGEALDAYDSALQKIELYLENLDFSGGGTVSGDYALLSEAGYSLALSMDENYVMSISLLNKAGDVLSTKNVDLPLETMFINASYLSGIITLTLQNGNTLDVDISDIVVGLVPTSRTIAGIDLTDDIKAEELVESTRKVTGQIYVDFENAEETEKAIFPYMPYPTDENGNKLIGEQGQFFVANGDGTYSWLTIANAEGGAY